MLTLAHHAAYFYSFHIIAALVASSAAWRRWRMWRISSNGASWTHLLAAHIWALVVVWQLISIGQPTFDEGGHVTVSLITVLGAIDTIGWRARARGRM